MAIMATIHIAGITWKDGELSGDAEQLKRLHQWAVANEFRPVPLFGNGPWYDVGVVEPFAFIATAQAAFGTLDWSEDGLEWPDGMIISSDQSETIA